MPRKPRIDSPGMLHHVIARGIERRNIFNVNYDRDIFLVKLNDILLETSTFCYAFALIPNHFHLLLLRTGAYPIATVMSRLLTSYAIRFNKRYKRAGHLFQNRYKDIICQEDIYLIELIRYINLNPFRAGIVEDIDELKKFKYSSHRLLLDKNNPPTWFPKEEILELFNIQKMKARRAYQDFLMAGVNMGKRREFSGGGLKRSLGFPKVMPKQKVVFDERVLGDSDFVLQILEQEDRRGKLNINSRYQDIDEIIEEICGLFDLRKEELIGEMKMRKISHARAIVSYLATKYLGYSAAKIADYLELNRSSVVRAVDRGMGLAKKYGLE